MLPNTTPIIVNDIFYYKGDFLFETKEGFTIQALTASNQSYIFCRAMGMEDLLYFQGEHANKLPDKIGTNNTKSETCFFNVLRDSYTTKLKNYGIRVNNFDLSHEGYKYGEVTIKISGVRIGKVK